MNTNTQPKVFEWNDELVKEFIHDSIAPSSEIHQELNDFMNRFKEKKQPIEDRIVVGDIIECSIMGMVKGFAYTFKVSKDIPKEKHEAVKQAIEGVLNNDNKITSIDNAGVIAVKISEICNPKLTTQEQAFFISGFQECIKWMQLGCPTPQPQDTKEDNPDYEILIIEYCGEQRFLRSDGLYRIFSDGVGFDLQYLLGMGGKIIQVARKSDNEVLSVDDITSEGKITGFATFKNIMSVQFENGLRSCGINVPEKAPKEEQKPVLFTTEDGVDVIADQIFSRVMLPDSDEPWKLVKDVKATNELYYTANIYFKNFSTKEAAEQYILENKPFLSVKDVYSITAKYGIDAVPIEKEIEKLAKSKTNQ